MPVSAENKTLFFRSHTASLLPTQVKVLFVRKLATAVTEELLEKTFSQFGKLERVKKLKDYAFVHFEERDAAVKVRCYSGTHLFLHLC